MLTNIQPHTQCELPTLDGLKHKWFSKYSFKQNPCLNNLSYDKALRLSILGLGLNLLRSEYTFYSCFGDRNGKFWACDVCFHVTYLIQGLAILTCYMSSWHLGSPPPLSWCLLITDGPLLSLYVTRLCSSATKSKLISIESLKSKQVSQWSFHPNRALHNNVIAGTSQLLRLALSSLHFTMLQHLM